ncbi:hypothetical protein REPUB_Repub17cG0064400 [Reevesia pubescens]
MSTSTWFSKMSLNMRSLLKEEGSQSLIKFCLMETTLLFWSQEAHLIQNEIVSSSLFLCSSLLMILVPCHILCFNENSGAEGKLLLFYSITVRCSKFGYRTEMTVVIVMIND